MEGRGIKLMQIIEIVSSVATSKDIDLVLITVGSVHITRTWRFTSMLIIKPLKLLQIENVHIVSCKRSLTEPSSNNVKSIFDQSGSMPVSSLWRNTTWLHRLLPAITIRIKYAQITMILFTIVATKDI